MQRDSFVFYKSYAEALHELNDKQRLSVYDALVKFAIYGEEPELSGLSKAIFVLMKPQIEANNKKYENGIKGAEAGAKGGRPRKNPVADTNENGGGDIKNNPLGVFENNPEKTPNENENENDKEKDRSIDRSKKKAEVSDDSGNTDQVEITDDHHLASFLQAHPTIRVDITSTAQLYGKDFSIVARAFRNSKWLQENCNSLSYICRKYEKIISGDYDGLGTPEHASGGEVGGLRPPRVEYKVL